MSTVHEEMRALLVAICTDVGFPPPQADQGLGRWADECLDVALAPRGSDHWRAAHDHVIDALAHVHEGLNLGSDFATHDAMHAIRLAKDLAVAHGRSLCACEEKGHPFKDANGRNRCVKCLARIQ